MSRFFVHKGRPVMWVIPAKALFHSSMIHDVVTSGRRFVVDLETGTLTIAKPEDLMVSPDSHGSPRRRSTRAVDAN